MVIPLRVLVLEDSADDAELVLEHLRQAGYEPDWQRVWTPETFAVALQQRVWDIVLADYSMPRFSAPAALQMLQATGRDIPFLVVSGSIGEPMAAEVMRMGARDVFLKGHLHRLAQAVQRELQEARARAERHTAFEQLREIEARHSLLVNSIKDYALLLLDGDGRVSSWNPGAERLTGYNETEVLGREVEFFFPPHGQSRGQALLQAARVSGLVSEETWLLRKDGREFWAEITIQAIRDVPHQGYSAILHDVSARKKLVEDLRLAVRARDEFLATASHELKTPLTSLRLQLEILRKLEASQPNLRLGDAKTKGKLEALQRQGERLGLLVDNLLDVTRITSGRMDLRRERLDLEQIVRGVTSRMKELIDQARCRLSVTAVPELWGNWDRLRLETVIANLVSNAIKYGAGKPIAIELSGDGERVVMTIRDHGIGIPVEEQSRIFERFERAVPDYRHVSGFGLGLWIARQVIEAHGGTISVQSEQGEGSSFRVQLPRHLAEPGAA